MRKNFYISLSFAVSSFIAASAQAPIAFPSDPSKAQFVLDDVHHFWEAFDSLQTNSALRPFEDLYIKKGSQGLQDFVPEHLINADTLHEEVIKRKDEYLSNRENTLKVLYKEKQCRTTYYAMKYWYPSSVFPPVYFVVGRFNMGGTASPNGLLIGTEKIKPENVPYLIAHELIHFQQNIAYKDSSLLEECLVEGSADFLGELISGDHIKHKAFAYAREKEEAIWKEFKTQMNSKKLEGWLYGPQVAEGERPNEVGYWIGYQISKAYFDRAKDKKKAVHDILNIKDSKVFLKQSGYGVVW